MAAGLALAAAELNPRSLPAGRLVIGRAVHCDVGSSLSVHRHLVAVLVKLFATCDATMPDEKLAAVFPRSYSGPW